jgi:hypothetical protein
MVLLQDGKYKERRRTAVASANMKPQGDGTRQEGVQLYLGQAPILIQANGI